jgi:hypothetical protein
MYPSMWIVNSNIAKALVWLAAAMLPADALYAGVCNCNEPSAVNARSKSAETHRGAMPCCRGGKTCKCCCHKMQNARRSACCANKLAGLAASRSPVAQVCNCPGNQTPESKTTLPGTSAARQLVNHAVACLGLTTAASPSPVLHSANQDSSLAAAQLDRLSNLCRLNI